MSKWDRFWAFLSRKISHARKPKSFDDIGSTEVWYFAFGSNLDPEVFQNRRGLVPQQAIPGILDDYRLAFNLASLPWIEPVMGNLAQKKGGCVHGVLYKLSESQFNHLHITEGGDPKSKYGLGSYNADEVQVKTYEGQTITARTFISREVSREVGGEVPSRRYLKLLQNGAKAHQLHPDYQEFLKDHPYNQLSSFSRFLAFLLIVVWFLPWGLLALVLYPAGKLLGVGAKASRMTLMTGAKGLWLIRKGTRSLHKSCRHPKAAQPYHKEEHAKFA